MRNILLAENWDLIVSLLSYVCDKTHSCLQYIYNYTFWLLQFQLLHDMRFIRAEMNA